MSKIALTWKDVRTRENLQENVFVFVCLSRNAQAFYFEGLREVFYFFLGGKREGSKFERVNTPIPPTIGVYVIIPYRFSSFSEGYPAITWRDAHVLP